MKTFTTPDGVVHHDACDECGIHQVFHPGCGGAKDLCCACHVRAGHPPADWHRVCMETYAAMEKLSGKATIAGIAGTFDVTVTRAKADPLE